MLAFLLTLALPALAQTQDAAKDIEKMVGKKLPDAPKAVPSAPKGVKTAGAAFDGLVAGPVDEAFPAAELETGGKAVYLAKKAAGAALYADDKDDKKAKRWYLQFLFTRGDKKRQTAPIQVFGSADEGFVAFPGRAAVSLAGPARPAGFDFEQLGALRLVKGSSAAKGVYAVLENKDVVKEVQKGANCLGPAVWWGVTQAEAQTACEKADLK